MRVPRRQRGEGERGDRGRTTRRDVLAVRRRLRIGTRSRLDVVDDVEGGEAGEQAAQRGYR